MIYATQRIQVPITRTIKIIITTIQVRLLLIIIDAVSAMCGWEFMAPHQWKQLRLTTTDLVVFSYHNNESLYRRRLNSNSISNACSC